MHVRIIVAVLLLTAPALAEEGMWTFDNPPTQALKDKYNFTPTKEWLEQVINSKIQRLWASAEGSTPQPASPPPLGRRWAAA